MPVYNASGSADSSSSTSNTRQEIAPRADQSAAHLPSITQVEGMVYRNVQNEGYQGECKLHTTCSARAVGLAHHHQFVLCSIWLCVKGIPARSTCCAAERVLPVVCCRGDAQVASNVLVYTSDTKTAGSEMQA